MVDNFISHRQKIAQYDIVEDKLKLLIRGLWKPSNGFFENLLRLAPYLAPLLGVPWLTVIAATIGSHMLGLSAMDFGRYLDSKLGTGPGSSLNVSELSAKLEGELSKVAQEYQTKTALTNNHIIKEANVFGFLLKSGKLTSMFIKGIMKLVSGILALYGISNFDEFIREMTKPIRQEIPSILPAKSEAPATLDKKETIDTMIDQLEQKYNLGA